MFWAHGLAQVIRGFEHRVSVIVANVFEEHAFRFLVLLLFILIFLSFVNHGIFARRIIINRSGRQQPARVLHVIALRLVARGGRAGYVVLLGEIVQD